MTKSPDSLIKSTLFKGDVMLSYTKICGKNGNLPLDRSGNQKRRAEIKARKRGEY